MVKWLLVDDSSLYVEGLADFLRCHGLNVVGTAGNGLEALVKVEIYQPDVILMDVQMEGCDGIETTRIIKHDFPHIEIVMLSVSEDEEHLFEAIRAGASGYLLKHMKGEILWAQIQSLMRGEAPLAPTLVRRILREFSQLKPSMEQKEIAETEQAALNSLSERQEAILKLMIDGLTYREISETIDLRETTIKYHVNEILRKLRCNNRTQLIAYASKFYKDGR
ncbi:MAG: response regulator transcription factor [Sporomusaceae bacterium]|nr:response regulator transcription factor [Sporomusaceae bacterium]